MSKILKLFAVLAMIGLAACSKDEAPQEINSFIIRSSSSGAILQTYNVEIANTKEKMYTGLMGRTSLDKNAGFLFDVNMVPQDIDVAMWMKDTLIPLDMLFIDEEGVIFSIHKNAKPGDVTPIYPPKRPHAVLEINGGQAHELNINIGDTVEGPFFKNNK